MPQDAGVLSWMLDIFMSAFSLGHTRIGSEAMSLLGKLAVIEIAICGLWWAFGKSDVIQHFIKKCIFIGFFIWVVTEFPYLIDVVIRSFVGLGLRAGGNTVSVSSFFNPSQIADYGFRVVTPILERFAGVGLLKAGLVEAVVLGWTGILILIAYFLIAIQIFITLVEFYLLSIVALCLIPFGVFKHTRFIAERSFGLIVSFGVKCMVLALLLSISQTIFTETATFLNTASNYKHYFTILLTSLGLCFLFWQAPALAASILSGAPSLTAGSAAGATLAAGVGAAATGAVVTAGTRGGYSAVRRTAGAAAAKWTPIKKINPQAANQAAAASRIRPPQPVPSSTAAKNANPPKVVKDDRKPLYQSLAHAPMAHHAVPPESAPQGSSSAPIKDEGD